MARNLSIGLSGPDVRDLQLSLNSHPPSALLPLKADGIFGPKTAARAKEYQANNGLTSDGVVGPKTRAALSGQTPPVDHGPNCCNGEKFIQSQAGMLAALFKAQQLAVGNPFASSGNKAGFVGPSGGSSVASLAPSGPIRMLTPTQQTTAVAVYGSSLDFSTIFITDKTGLGGRPFTVAFPDQGQIVQIMNCGTFAPKEKTLIHELAHVWQSQHHPDKFRFMVNAVDSQAGAVVASSAAAVDDPFVILNKDFPTFWPFDAYAYHPSLPFVNLAAEQMASAIHQKEPAIVSHVAGVAKNAVDASLVTALSKPGFADRRLKGVK